MFIEELSSGDRAITGVPTSIAAFLGRTRRGPVDEPVLLHSFSEYERIYGGLSPDSSVSYAVKDFFANGGWQAVIQRLYRPPPGETSPVGRLELNGLLLVAANPGTWGGRLRARVDRQGSSPQAGGRPHLADADLFNLEVIEEGLQGSPAARERFMELSVRPDAGERRVDRVLQKSSQLVRVPGWEDGSPDLPEENPALIVPGSPFILADGGLDSEPLEDGDYEQGLERLNRADLVNLLCIPPDRRAAPVSKAVYRAGLAFCVRRRAMLLVDPQPDWGEDLADFLMQARQVLESELDQSGVAARNAALYFPLVIQPDPLEGGRLKNFPPCGLAAGLMARIDGQRGVWKAPAGVEATLLGAEGLQVNLTDRENGILNPLGVNCLRHFPGRGLLAWGARTLRGADHLADEFKYVPVRRLALFIEESLERGTQWVVFEPNEEATWAQIRSSVNAFLHGLFLQGAFAGRTPPESYFVKCGLDTMTPDDIRAGIVTIQVGFAPLRPAEFILLEIRQRAGGAPTEVYPSQSRLAANR